MGTGDAADQVTFIEAVVPWLEQQAFIERYAAFGELLDVQEILHINANYSHHR